MIEKELVSIVMPMYNGQDFVSEAIDSVLRQSYECWELIIVDDKSIDDSYELVKAFIKNEPRIKLHQMQKKSGVTEARNYAISLALGGYIAFLDSDDLWLSEKLYVQIEFMKKNDLVLTYASYDTIDENLNYINTRTCLPYIIYHDMLKSNRIGHLTGIYDVNYFGKVYFEEVGHEDYVMWLKLLKQIPFTLGLKESLAQYRIVPGSLSSDKYKALQWQWHIYRKIEKLNFLQSIYYFVFYIYNALKKRS